MMRPKEFLAFAKENNAKMIDLKFTDLLGTWQHCSFPTETWDEETFVDGVGFDGSFFWVSAGDVLGACMFYIFDE